MSTEKARTKLLREAFNLTPAQWDLILDFQNGKCFICQKRIDQFKTSAAPRPHTDHDHKTGLVRGLLCSQCNRALGKAQDPRWGWTPECFYRAYEYLTTPPATGALGGEVHGYPGALYRRGKPTQRFKKWIADKTQIKLFE